MSGLSLVRIFLVLSLALASAGCLNNSSDSKTVGPEGIYNNLYKSNLDSNAFPWEGRVHERSKRWQGAITVYFAEPHSTTDEDRARVVRAMDEIESKVPMIQFDRRLDTLPEDDDVGLVISFGSAVGAWGVINSNACGNVGGAPHAVSQSFSYPWNFYADSGEINTQLYVHIDSAKCRASHGVIIHEFGHALGLGEHFEGFGIGPPINANFWNALWNLYNHEPGEDADIIRATVNKAF